MSTTPLQPACNFLIPAVLCRLDMLTMSKTHTLKSRDISVASASSFIIVVSVGFFGLLMVCVGSSSYYRQRLARRQEALLGATRQATVPVTPPQLWDVSYTELKAGTASLHNADWEHVQPLAVKVEGEEAGVNTVEKIVVAERTPRSRLTAWLGYNSSRTISPASESAPAATPPAAASAIVKAEVAILIAMPSVYANRQSQPQSRPSQSEEGSPWTAECAVGTSSIPYRAKAQGPVT